MRIRLTAGLAAAALTLPLAAAATPAQAAPKVPHLAEQRARQALPPMTAGRPTRRHHRRRRASPENVTPSATEPN